MTVYHKLKLFEDDGIINQKKPVVSETYEDVIFSEPHEDFYMRVSRHVPGACTLGKGGEGVGGTGWDLCGKGCEGEEASGVQGGQGEHQERGGDGVGRKHGRDVLVCQAPDCVHMLGKERQGQGGEVRMGTAWEGLKG